MKQKNKKELSYADLQSLDAGRPKTANAQAAPGANAKPAGSGAGNAQNCASRWAVDDCVESNGCDNPMGPQAHENYAFG